jgi:hypothetical protein
MQVSFLLSISQASLKGDPKPAAAADRNKANKQLKALLHNGAMSAIQHSKEIKDYYIRKTSEGKHEIRTADAAGYQ